MALFFSTLVKKQAGLACVLALSGGQLFASNQQENTLGDYRILTGGRQKTEVKISAKQAGKQSIFVEGLARGGAVLITVNDKLPLKVELLASTSEKARPQHADSARVTAELRKGVNRVKIEEKDGVQIVNVRGTSVWFGTSSESRDGPRFIVDFSAWKNLEPAYPFTVYYGGAGEEFLHFSGKFDWYYGESYTAAVDDISGDSGEDSATLNYVALHPSMGLRMPMGISLTRGLMAGNFSLRIRQTLQAEGAPVWKDNLQFLHVVLSKKYGEDWSDGVPDWTWFRTGPDRHPNAFEGTRTALARMRDWSARTFSFPSSTEDSEKRKTSSIHHTGAAFSMESGNAVGGWFSKKDVGSCGLVFHSYRANFRNDLRPLHSHCGDGADTHFYIFWGELFSPLGMKRGDEIEIEYSLWFFPADLQLTDILDLNEVDIAVFGDEATSKSPLSGWVGARDMVGLTREDGSMLLLALPGGAGKVPLPPGAGEGAKSVDLLTDPGRNVRSKAKVHNGLVDAAPGEFVIIDYGAALSQLGPR